MHQPRYWGLVVALGTCLGGFGVVAPGIDGPLGVTRLGWFVAFVGVTLVATGAWGLLVSEDADGRVATADHAVLFVAILVVVAAILASHV